MMDAARTLLGDVLDSTSDRVTNGLSSIASAAIVKGVEKASIDPILYQNLMQAADTFTKIELSNDKDEIIHIIYEAKHQVDLSTKPADNLNQNFSLLLALRNAITSLHKHISSTNNDEVSKFHIKQLMRCLLVCNLSHPDFHIRETARGENPLENENIPAYFKDNYPDIFNSDETLPSIASNILNYTNNQQTRADLENTDCPDLYSLLTIFPILAEFPYANQIMTSSRNDLSLSIRVIHSILGILSPPQIELTIPTDTNHGQNIKHNLTALATQALIALANIVLTALSIMCALSCFVLYIATNMTLIQILTCFAAMLTSSVATLAASCYFFIATSITEKLANVHQMRPILNTNYSTKPYYACIWSTLTSPIYKTCSTITAYCSI